MWPELHETRDNTVSGCICPATLFHYCPLLLFSFFFLSHNISPLHLDFSCFFSPCTYSKRPANTCNRFSLTSLSLPLSLTFHFYSLCLPLSLFFFFLLLPPLLLACCCREECLASYYYLPRSESTARLWYTGSMVSRYTPATAAPFPRPLDEPRAFPRFHPLGPTVDLPRSPAYALALPRCPLTPPLSGEPCFAAPLVLSASILCLLGLRDVSTIGLSKYLSNF